VEEREGEVEEMQWVGGGVEGKSRVEVKEVNGGKGGKEVREAVEPVLDGDGV
jgi:hypothetical protein